jgi:tetratricopeptide (TPR) repeat protein
MTRAPALSMVLALVVLSLSSVALADEPSEDNKARARELLQQGDVAYRLQHLEQALARYQEAYKLVEHPAVLFNVAQALRQLKHTDKALFYYKLFITDWQSRFPDKPVPYEQEVRIHIDALKGQSIKEAGLEAERKRKEAERKRKEEETEEARRKDAAARALAALRAPVKVRLVGMRPGSALFVDGRPWRQKGSAVRLSPGRHRLRVEASGCRQWSEEIQVHPAEPRDLQVEQAVIDVRTVLLVASASASAVAAGFLGVGVAYNLEHNRYIKGTVEADEAREMSIVGYAVAGGAAAMAVAGWTAYLLHRRSVNNLLDQGDAPGDRHSLGIAPTPGGAALFGRVTF